MRAEVGGSDRGVRAHDDAVERAADSVLHIFGEHTEDLIDETAMATFHGGMDAYIDHESSDEVRRHNEMTFARICRAVAPKLLAAADAAEQRARAGDA